MHTKQYYFNSHIRKYKEKEKFSKNISRTTKRMIMVTQETEIRSDQGKITFLHTAWLFFIAKGIYVFTQ